MGKVIALANQKGGVRKDYNSSQFKCDTRKKQ